MWLKDWRNGVAITELDYTYITVFVVFWSNKSRLSAKETWDFINIIQIV